MGERASQCFRKEFFFFFEGFEEKKHNRVQLYPAIGQFKWPEGENSFVAGSSLTWESSRRGEALSQHRAPNPGAFGSIPLVNKQPVTRVRKPFPFALALHPHTPNGPLLSIHFSLDFIFTWQSFHV